MTAKHIMYALLLAAALTSPARAAGNFSGTWTVNGVPPAVCNIVQKDKVLSGDCKMLNLAGPLSGSIEGNKVAWRWQMANEKSSGTMEFSGEWDSNNAITKGQMQGSNMIGGLQMPPQAIPFTAARQPGK